MSLCNEVKVDIKFLSSIISSQCHGSTERYMKEFADGVERWILESVEVIKQATETFRKEANLKLPQPFTWAGSVSLFPIHNGPGTVIVQLILWSCFNQACHDSIMKCLNDAKEGNKTLPQDTSSCSNGMLWTWLQSYAFCVKTSVHYSCKYMLTKANEDPVDRTLVNPPLWNSIFLETCFVTGTISKTAEFFTFIGTNPKPFDYHRSSYYSAQPREATKNFLCYLRTWPKVSFKNTPTAMIGEGKFTNETHNTSDILTMMLGIEEFRNHLKITKETKIQPSVTPPKNTVITKKNSTVKKKEDLTLQPVQATPLTLQFEKANKDGKRKKPVVGKSLMRPKLLTLSKLLEIDFTLSEIKIEAAVKKITKKINEKSRVKLTEPLDHLKVAVLSSCVSTLLKIKTLPLLLGEHVLLKIVNDALIGCKEENVNMKLDHELLPLLIEHLSGTLFKDVTMLTGISQKGFVIPIKEEHFWQTQFRDECDIIHSSRAMKRNPCNGDIINNPTETKLTKKMKQESVLPNAVEEEESSLKKKGSITKKQRKEKDIGVEKPSLEEKENPIEGRVVAKTPLKEDCALMKSGGKKNGPARNSSSEKKELPGKEKCSAKSKSRTSSRSTKNTKSPARSKKTKRSPSKSRTSPRKGKKSNN